MDCTSPPSYCDDIWEYKVNEICYNINSRDDTRMIQNNGVVFVSSTTHVVSAKEKTPIIADMSLYGVILEIWKSITLILGLHYSNMTGLMRRLESCKRSRIHTS